jgi:hypothetical protein
MTKDYRIFLVVATPRAHNVAPPWPCPMEPFLFLAQIKANRVLKVL